MLREDFIPVAIDQWYHRRTNDNEGEFYRRIASQGPRSDFSLTTQGRYICSPDGTLLAFNNNRGPEKIARLMKESLASFDDQAIAAVEPIESGSADPKFELVPPKDGLILRVHSKVLGGYIPSDNWTAAFQESVGRDNAWLSSAERKALLECIQKGGEVPSRIARRLARFHLIDNTRGEPPRWQADEIRELKLRVDKSGKIQGIVHLETKSGKRGFTAQILGVAKVEQGTITQFDLVAKGDFWGEGPYTGRGPKGKFPLAIAFRIADGSDPADTIAPHGTKGWLEGYYQ